MIKEKYIDLVKSRVDICQLVVDVCPGTVLKKAGRYRKKCKCVFHKEDTPSMLLDSTTNLYYCFGCEKGGDVITFVEESQGLGFDGAVRYLLDMYCPDVDTSDLYEKRTPEEDELYRKQETMYIYNKYAYDFFRSQYLADTPEAAACRRYAEKESENPTHGRWDSDFCRTYGLGYSPLSGNRFVAFAKGKGLKWMCCFSLA